MGFWSSIEVSYEIEEIWYSKTNVQRVPNIRDLNKIFKNNDFFNFPFGGEGMPTIEIFEDYDGKIIISISCRDESISEMEIIKWWYHHIWTLHATKAKLKIVPDWTSSKTILKYNMDVKAFDEVIN